MQRRAAAIYFAFFVLIGAGSYAFIGMAQQPTVSLDAPTYSQGDQFSVGGQQYTVSEITVETSEGGGHGGGGGESVVGTVEWTNESAQFTATLENNSTVTYRDDEWRLLVPNGSDVSEFRLREEQNASEILASDPAVQNETATFQGQRHVVYANGSLGPPLSEYLPDPETETIQSGSEFPYEGNTTTVSSITSEEVTLTWTGAKTNTAELTDGGNVTLGGQTYLVYFPSENQVQFTQDYDAYQTQLDRIDYYHERINGFWGVSIISLVAAIILLGTAYLPVRG
ncbi:hypothetical protein BRC83_02260 [Halobacteriales archaeon QS_1_68_17]|nr:MAG: hypothetical protein BRC83_02260 [Halobacteriales archaeon QS_1_68_17]